MKSTTESDSSTVAELSQGLIAISIDDSERDASKNASQPTDESKKETEPLLPLKVCYEWKDITQEFFESVKELQLGELVHHQKLFGLFEAMSAIEMMDPKMDAGMCCNKNPGGPLTFETAVETKQMKLVSFEPSELIGIMDGIYACLISWLDGHSLAQTMFTCLYLHQPHSIEDKTLRAFCCAMHKLTQIIRKFVLHAKVYEEEDFDPRDYGYVLTPDVVNTKACFMLKEAEDELTKQLKAIPDGNEGLQGIIGRIKFLRQFLQALSALAPSKSVSPNEQEMNEIVRLLNGAADLIPLIKRTISLGTQPDPDDDAPNPMGFSPTVNQRVLPPTFPRYTKIKARDFSISFLEELVYRTKQACKIVHCVNYHSALNFFIEFSKKSGPCLLSRSILQCLYFPQPNSVFGVTPVTDMLRDSVKLFCAPTVLVLRNNFTSNAQVKFCIETFFKYCMNMYSFVMFIQICGYNRARQRDKLARLLDDFASLQDEAERVDTYLCDLNPDEADRRPYFSTWVLYHCLRAMAMYLLSGLELELYSVHEYMYIYWYLSDYLYNWIITTLTRAECLADQTQKPSTKSKKPKAKKKSMKLYGREVMFSQALKNMFSGYYNALAGFTKDDRIPQPLSIFDNERVRFDHRFAPFFGLTTPPPVSYNQFKEYRTYTLNRSSMNLYLDASNYFHRARTILEVIPNADSEIIDIIKIAKINYVVMNLLANGHKKDSKCPPEFDFSIHKYFPTIKQN